MDAKQERKVNKQREHQEKVEERRKRNAERPGLFRWMIGGIGLVMRTVFAPVFWLLWLMKWSLYLMIGAGVLILILVLFGLVRWAWPKQPDEPRPPASIQLYQGDRDDHPQE